MIKYLYTVIEEFPEVLWVTKASSAGDHIFTVREDRKKKLLPEEQARQFHCTVAQLLFLCKRARPDIEPVILFLATRVKEPDEDEWLKLRHGMMYLNGILYMKIHMKADSLSMII